MSKGKFVAFSLIAAALLSWQIAGVNIATSGTSGIVDPCSSLASSTGGTGCYLVCPLGDGDRLEDIGATISIVAKDATGTPLAAVPGPDFWLVGCNDGLVLCGGGGSINADSASNANGETTMSGDLSGSGCDLGGVVVVIQGVLVQDAGNSCNIQCIPLTTMSPDISGDGGVIDGIVELVDFSSFGAHFDTENGVDPAYDACYDYNCDGFVELVDFSVFGRHWQHSCQG
jgi:hypothetical protein